MFRHTETIMMIVMKWKQEASQSQREEERLLRVGNVCRAQPEEFTKLFLSRDQSLHVARGREE